jgi:hypothetical protein
MGCKDEEKKKKIGQDETEDRMTEGRQCGDFLLLLPFSIALVSPLHPHTSDNLVQINTMKSFIPDMSKKRRSSIRSIC